MLNTIHTTGYFGMLTVCLQFLLSCSSVITCYASLIYNLKQSCFKLTDYETLLFGSVDAGLRCNCLGKGNHCVDYSQKWRRVWIPAWRLEEVSLT